MFKMLKTMLVVSLGLTVPTLTCTAAQSPVAGGAGAPAARELSPEARDAALRRAVEERLRVVGGAQFEVDEVVHEFKAAELAKKLKQLRLALAQEGLRRAAEHVLAQTPMPLGDLPASPASGGGASTVAARYRSDSETGSVSPASPTALRLRPSPMSPRHPRRLLEAAKRVAQSPAAGSDTASPK